MFFRTLLLDESGYGFGCPEFRSGIKEAAFFHMTAGFLELLANLVLYYFGDYPLSIFLDSDEIVQLYIRAEVSSVTRPIKELRGFRRITLDSGQTNTVVFSLGPSELSFLDRDMHRVVEPATIQIMLGGNSVDLIETKLSVVDK